MWNTGDRMMAQRAPGDYWYPGTIRHIQEDRYFVIFDDGEDGFVRAPQLKPLQLEIGDRVLAYAPGKREFEPARISDKRADELQVQFDRGGLAWVTTAKVCIGPETWQVPAPQTSEWSLGDRVLAPWFDLFWYPGKILSTTPDQVGVLFDHGGYASLAHGQVHPLVLDEGEVVQGRWQAGGEYFPGKIVRKSGEVVEIHYDDGDDETTLIALVRVVRDDWLPGRTEQELGPGDRVLGCWLDGNWYPGIILTIDGKRIHVLFDDNDQAFLTWDRVRSLTIEVGDRVSARWQGGPFYIAGEVKRKQGERIYMQYDDGREEWTSIRLVRVERKPPEEQA